MATIKTKNSNGEWTVSGKATVFEKMVGQFKVGLVQKTPDAYAYDLSQYIEPHDDFIFVFRSTLNHPASARGGGTYVLYKIDGELVKASWSSADTGWWDTTANTTISNLFGSYTGSTGNVWSYFDGVWDNDARTLTFPDSGAHTYGILFYAGLGEEV